MVVMGVWAFILCIGHRWRNWTKEQQPWNNTKQIFPEQKTKKAFAQLFCFTSSVSSTRSFDWNLESINIWTNCQFIWSGKVYIWLSVLEFQKPCLNKLMHIQNWETDQPQHDLYVDISYKFTFAWVFVSHACTQINLNTLNNNSVLMRVPHIQ